MPNDFTLEEARAAVRDLAPGGLALPLSRADLATIAAPGVEVKDSEHGLLDFPVEVDGVPAYWCWRVGELERSSGGIHATQVSQTAL